MVEHLGINQMTHAIKLCMRLSTSIMLYIMSMKSNMLLLRKKRKKVYLRQTSMDEPSIGDSLGI